MRRLARLFALCLALSAAPAAAQGGASAVVVEEWIGGQWVVVDPAPLLALPPLPSEPLPPAPPAARFVTPSFAEAPRPAQAQFGPFRVAPDGRRAMLVGVTDSRAPGQFAAMLAAYPDIAVLDFVEAPGTRDDRANLALGRMIRDRGLATHVGAGGSVRSGAVELFIAGATRSIAPQAEFAVHGWLDDWGRGAEDYPANAPEHRRYLDYYAEMGMAPATAAAFYAMTNSVPFEEALWLTGAEIRDWLGEDGAAAGEVPAPALPRLAYLDLGLTLH